MINKLYKMKQQQINQQLLLKHQVVAKIDDIDDHIESTKRSYHSATIDVMGAISDFRVLEIHKETMKDHMIKLLQKKEYLLKQIEVYDREIIILNKESEQFDYIIQENKRIKLKEIIKQEEIVASEYMQAKYIKNKRVQNAY